MEHDDQRERLAASVAVTASATSAAISRARVSINGRYSTTTDRHEQDSVTGLLDYGENPNFTYVSTNGYASDRPVALPHRAIQTMRQSKRKCE